jgi:dUTP pyrophosphatase
MAILSGSDIRKLIAAAVPLVEGYVNLDEQVQANGFDLSLRDIGVIQTGGQVAADDAGRVIPEISPLVFDALGFIELPAGIYQVTYNEVVHLPRNVMALGRPRSSLLRCGVTVGTAVWDAGYEGRSRSLLVIYNSRGFRVQRNARLTQLVFMELTGDSAGYDGFYQGENI